MTPHPLVQKIYLLAEEAALAIARLNAAKAELIAQGKGSYLESERRSDGAALRRVIVNVPTAGRTTLDLYPSSVMKAHFEQLGIEKPLPDEIGGWFALREKEAQRLSGAKFYTIFDRVVRYAPKNSFEALAQSHLTPARARDVIALCKTTSAPAKPSVRLLDLGGIAEAEES